jgi:putative membrane protein
LENARDIGTSDVVLVKQMLKPVSEILTLLVALLHGWFLILEMFLWQSPLGLKTFSQSAEKARHSAVLAANQGLYNGFLAAGLIASLVIDSPETAYAFRVYFLGCVILAGLYGAWSVSSRILYVQAVPAALALAASIYARYLVA